MNRAALTMACAALFGSAPALAADQSAEFATPTPARILSSDLGGSDMLFLSDAGHAIALITDLTVVAKLSASTPEVKALAAATWKEQTDASDSFKQLLDKKQMPASVEADVNGKKQLETLVGLKGMRFDKFFLDTLADAQARFESALAPGLSSSDPDIKAFATAEAAALKVEKQRLARLGL